MRIPAIIQLLLVFFAFGMVYCHWQSRMQTPVMQPARPTRSLGREEDDVEMDVETETQPLYDRRP
jgi:hypothetical protein